MFTSPTNLSETQVPLAAASVQRDTVSMCTQTQQSQTDFNLLTSAFQDLNTRYNNAKNQNESLTQALSNFSSAAEIYQNAATAMLTEISIVNFWLAEKCKFLEQQLLLQLRQTQVQADIIQKLTQERTQQSREITWLYQHLSVVQQSAGIPNSSIQANQSEPELNTISPAEMAPLTLPTTSIHSPIFLESTSTVRPLSWAAPQLSTNHFGSSARKRPHSEVYSNEQVELAFIEDTDRTKRSKDMTIAA